MKFFQLCIYAILSIVTASCTKHGDYSYMFDSSDPAHIQLAKHEMFEFAIELQAEGLNLVKYGGEMRVNVQNFSMLFVSDQEVDIDGARHVFMNMSEQFLRRVNASEAIRPYLATYPITPKNLDLGVLFLPSTPLTLDYITDAGMLNSLSEMPYVTVFYAKHNRETGAIQTVYQESYQRALGILKHQNNVAGVPPFCLRSDINDKGP